jgi:hypothetical protein
MAPFLIFLLGSDKCPVVPVSWTYELASTVRGAQIVLRKNPTDATLVHILPIFMMKIDLGYESERFFLLTLLYYIYIGAHKTTSMDIHLLYEILPVCLIYAKLFLLQYQVSIGKVITDSSHAHTVTVVWVL